MLLQKIRDHLKTVDPLWRFPEEKKELTLSHIYAMSQKYASALAFSGVLRSDRVGILSTNRIEYIPLILGIWKIGAVAVPLRPVMGLSEDYEDYLERVEESCAFSTIIFETDEDCAVAAVWSAIAAKNSLSLTTLDNYDGDFVSPDVQSDPNDLAIIQYSSGSTGVPKGIMVSHQMVINQVDLLSKEYLIASGATLKSSGSWLPFNHDMGLFIGILLPLFCGIPNTLASPRWYMMNPLRWFKIMAENAIGLNFTTNAAMAHTVKLMGKAIDQNLDLSALTLYFGAEKVTSVVLKRALSVFEHFKMSPRQVHIGYGMAENALGATATKNIPSIVRVKAHVADQLILASENDNDCLELVSIGTPFLDTRIEIRNGEGGICPDLTLGEIFVSGPCVTSGYFRNSEASNAALHSGWLKTNDVGFTHGGEIYFHSRKDDLIIVGGRNVIPDDVEQCTESLESVRAGATVLLAVDNMQNGTTDLYLLVETKPLRAEEIIERKKQIQELVFSAFALLVNHIVFCGKGSIEKTSSGKKRRKVIKERFIKNELILFS